MIEVRYINLNTISKAAITLILSTLIAYVIFNINKTRTIYNFVDLQMKYKNYILVNKSRSIFDDEKYIFVLQNPVNREKTTVYVKYYLYHNVYYVGDTIR